jgi:hypothetical protein
MINATEAKLKTEQRIKAIAIEFIWNTISHKITEAIEQGLFELDISVPSSASCDLATEVAAILHKSYSYQATTHGVTVHGETILHISWRSAEGN